MSKTEKSTKKNSFVFYRSFSDAMGELPEKDQLTLYRAIVSYGLDADEPTLDSPYLRMAWKLIQPQLDANWRRYENGCKGASFGKRGGAPKGNKNASRAKQPLNNRKTTPNDNVNDNDNVSSKEDKESKPKKDELSLPVSSDFIKFNDWVKTVLPHVAKIEKQMTEKQMNSLIAKFGKERFFDILRQMDNFKKQGRPVEKCYTSVYLTANNWLKRDAEKSERSNL